MLSAARNEMLTRVGPGTPMGNLLRRYWMPIAGASELTADKPIKPVRLLSEDLTLYKDLGGCFGLVARHCAHRGADLSCGTVPSKSDGRNRAAGRHRRRNSGERLLDGKYRRGHRPH